ncbi:transposase [Aspergillus affinis]|uniref:transposase n=1 Tax=Aspergillus affinis TaxID=1070780 RepID=UPI0022FEF1AE|nr:uncharacterized protein KD926_002936 [Aspergillus affinis]KAI9035747.1 hypothetical protein KD926_002936 [Aspergillus affinis]
MDGNRYLFDALVNFDYEYEVLLPNGNNVDILEERITPLENALAPEIAFNLSSESPRELLEDPIEQLPTNTDQDTFEDTFVSPLPPPTDRSFESDAAAREFLDNFTKQYGYALTTKILKRDPKDNEILVQYLHCDRSGTYKDRVREENRRNPYILIMDYTYKTNKYKMPLLDITGVTFTGYTFYAGSAFVHNEKQPSYDFAIRNLAKIYTYLAARPPLTILTDKEQALINACKEVFPTTDILICLSHVNQNILSKARICFRKDLRDSMDTAPDPKDKDAIKAFHAEVHAR